MRWLAPITPWATSTSACPTVSYSAEIAERRRSVPSIAPYVRRMGMSSARNASRSMPARPRSASTVIDSTHVSARLYRQVVSHRFIQISIPKSLIRITA